MLCVSHYFVWWVDPRDLQRIQWVFELSPEWLDLDFSESLGIFLDRLFWSKLMQCCLFADIEKIRSQQGFDVKIIPHKVLNTLLHGALKAYSTLNPAGLCRTWQQRAQSNCNMKTIITFWTPAEGLNKHLYAQCAFWSAQPISGVPTIRLCEALQGLWVKRWVATQVFKTSCVCETAKVEFGPRMAGLSATITLIPCSNLPEVGILVQHFGTVLR